MIANGINDRPGRLGPKVVLDAEKARAIFLSTKTGEELALENGVSPGQIFAIWRRQRWADATPDLEAPERNRGRRNTGLTLDLRPFDSAKPEPEIEQAAEPPGSLTLRLSPSRRVTLAEIRRAGEPIRIVPLVNEADVDAQLQLARRRDLVVVDERTRTEEEACQAATD